MKNSILSRILIVPVIVYAVAMIPFLLAVDSCGTVSSTTSTPTQDTLVLSVEQELFDRVDGLLKRVELVEALCVDLTKTTDAEARSDALFACSSVNDAKLYMIARRINYASIQIDGAQTAIDDARSNLIIATDQLEQELDQQGSILTRKLIIIRE